MKLHFLSGTVGAVVVESGVCVGSAERGDPPDKGSIFRMRINKQEEGGGAECGALLLKTVTGIRERTRSFSPVTQSTQDRSGEDNFNHLVTQKIGALHTRTHRNFSNEIISVFQATKPPWYVDIVLTHKQSCLPNKQICTNVQPMIRQHKRYHPVSQKATCNVTSINRSKFTAISYKYKIKL